METQKMADGAEEGTNVGSPFPFLPSHHFFTFPLLILRSASFDKRAAAAATTSEHQLARVLHPHSLSKNTQTPLPTETAFPATSSSRDSFLSDTLPTDTTASTAKSPTVPQQVLLRLSLNESSHTYAQLDPIRALHADPQSHHVWILRRILFKARLGRGDRSPGRLDCHPRLLCTSRGQR